MFFSSGCTKLKRVTFVSFRRDIKLSVFGTWFKQTFPFPGPH